VYDEPVVACTPPKWVQKTRVLNNLHPYDPERYPTVEKLIHSVIDFHDRNREMFKFYGHWDYGTLHNVFEISLYRWLVVGRYANIGNEENIVQAPWLAYFRSGDRKFLKFARKWTRHLMETQSIRWHNNFPEWAGMSRRHHYTPWLGGGDWGHTMLCPWLEYYHATGYYPAWQMALQTSETMAQTYKGAWRYISNPLIGNIRMYLETGEPKYKAVADRIWRELCYPEQNVWFNASHAARLCIWYARFNKDCMKSWKEWSKEGRLVGKRRNPEFQYMDSHGVLGDMTGDPFYAHKARMVLDGGLNTYSGMTQGVNPIYRGMVPTITQYIMGWVRMAPYAAEQIAKSRKLFPAGFYGLGYVRDIVIREDADADFYLYVSASSAKQIRIVDPAGKPVKTVVEDVMSGRIGKARGVKLYKVTVKADGRKGFYRVRGMFIRYFGCSLRHVAFNIGDTLKGGVGDPLYVRSEDLGGPDTRFLMYGSKGCSLEIFSLEGKRLFSKTYVRPAADAVGIEHRVKLPRRALLRLGDHVGIKFLSGANIPVFLNADGVFDLPK